MVYQKILRDLKKLSSLKRKKANEWFFKTGKGEYGEGDKFIGISMPNLRLVIKKHHKISNYSDIKLLINSPIHEVRMAGLLILNEKYNENPKKAYEFYLKNTSRINNWDLVDCTASNVIGRYLLDKKSERGILYKLARSKNLWERRIAIISTARFIAGSDIKDTLKLSKILLSDKHDLMHKAVGWMLRESWKKKPKEVEGFLKENYNKMPRTALRYAIERMNEKKRKKFLKGEF